MLAAMLASVAANNRESTRKVGGVNQLSARVLPANETKRGSQAVNKPL